MSESSSRLLIAEGRTAELFDAGDGYVLKRYRDGYPSDEAEREVRQATIAARRIADAGLRTPAVRETGWYEGRPGIVFERISGPTMLSVLLAEPKRAAEFGRMLARLQATLNGCSGEGLPVLKRNVRHDVERARAFCGHAPLAARLLETLPEGDSLCHGDFHPNNVLLSVDGPVVIDWVNAVQGDPLADVARTALLMMTASASPPPFLSRERLWSLRRQFTTAFLQEYRTISPFAENHYQQWLFITAVARYGEPGTDRQEKRRLTRLLQSLCVDLAE